MLTRIENNYTVYIHVFPNKKIYVGITGQKVKDRWRVNGNGYKPQKLVYRAIKKYGWENIEHIIIAENLTISAAGELEKKIIKKYNATNPQFGYNQSTGGENSPIGVKRSKETIDKLSKSHKGKVSRKGYHLTEEQKNHLSNINLGKKLSNEVKAKISKANKGTKPTQYAIEMAKKACNKPVVCLKTNVAYPSATIAQNKTGEHRNTITRHCRGEVQNPRWAFQK